MAGRDGDRVAIAPSFECRLRLVVLDGCRRVPVRPPEHVPGRRRRTVLGGGVAKDVEVPRDVDRGEAGGQGVDPYGTELLVALELDLGVEERFGVPARSPDQRQEDQSDGPATSSRTAAASRWETANVAMDKVASVARMAAYIHVVARSSWSVGAGVAVVW